MKVTWNNSFVCVVMSSTWYVFRFIYLFPILSNWYFRDQFFFISVIYMIPNWNHITSAVQINLISILNSPPSYFPYSPLSNHFINFWFIFPIFLFLQIKENKCAYLNQCSFLQKEQLYITCNVMNIALYPLRTGPGDHVISVYGNLAYPF